MIIGLCGAARAGKDSIADAIEAHVGPDVGVRRIKISALLKSYIRELFDWTEEHTDGDLKDTPDERYPRPCWTCVVYDETDQGDGSPCPHCVDGTTYLTPRGAMQPLGGEFADATYPPIYSVRAAREARAAVDGLLPCTTCGGKWPEVCSACQGTGKMPPYAYALVTDVRFLRDAQAIKDVGGVLVMVERPDNESGLKGAAAAHQGEQARNSEEFQALVDIHILNNGTLDDLRDAVVATVFGKGLP
jgi:hypothetical protein